jgi:hypothetical protein
MSRHTDRNGRKRGQVIVVLIMILVILFFAVIWNLDLHKIVNIRSMSQNAGDSAALMGARWQGITLNLIGDLNIMQAVALANDQPGTAAAITNLQARLCFVGPMIGFVACQQAAKNNRIYVNEGYRTRIREEFVPTLVSYIDNGRNAPYDDAWMDLLDIMTLLHDDGVAAMAEPLWPDEPDGDHYLTTPAFYEAIASKNWCWFLFNAFDLLNEYDNYLYWDREDPLPGRAGRPPRDNPDDPLSINSVIFGLGLVQERTPVTNWIPWNVVEATAAERNLDPPVSSAHEGDTGVWYCYGRPWEGAWDAISLDSADPFPAAGHVKPQYDYAGADAYVRIEAGFERLTPGPGGSLASNTIAWTAAAKPFGYLDVTNTPKDHQIVLPAFRNVQLIPLDASSSGEEDDPNIEWQTHISRRSGRSHLDEYCDNGPGGLPACFFCNQLRTWEIPAFRQEGILWLNLHDDDCYAAVGGGPGPGGPGPGPGPGLPGGRRRGH